MGYTKIFNSLLKSTIWQESKETRLVWITLLVSKNRDQVVESSIPGLAKDAGVTIKECEEALEILRSPDEYSRTKAFEGRRIEDIDGGWFILNGDKYQQKMSLEERREYKAMWARKKRERMDAEKIADGIPVKRPRKKIKPLPGAVMNEIMVRNGASEEALNRHSDSMLPEGAKDAPVEAGPEEGFPEI